ncbi:serine hydrolase domain-containing protein [Lacrimispora brassicae]
MFQLDSKTMDLINKTCKGKKHIKLTVGFFNDGNTAIKVFGEQGELPAESCIYEIGSITKTFTASLLSKYIFENKMQLNDSIQKYIAGLDTNNYYPTLRRIATHTAGYSPTYPISQREYLNLIIDMILGKNQGINPLQMDLDCMKMLIQKTRLRDTDYRWNYSNFGYSLLGYGAGIVSGKGYWDTMKDFLSTEFGLSHTYLGTYDNKNLSGFGTKNQECGNWHWEKSNLTAPAGAISSTAEDLLTYAKLNMYEEKPYFLLCHQKHSNGPGNYDMGLGWWLRQNNNNIMEHGGGTGCFSSYLAIDKSKKVASVVLANYRLGFDSDKKIGISVLEHLK